MILKTTEHRALEDLKQHQTGLMSSRLEQRALLTPVRALLHQTLEPVSCALIRVPISGFMPTVGTALARTVDTYSRDFSDWTTLVADETSIYSTRNGTYPLQTDLGIEPVVLLRDPVVSHIQRNINPSYSIGVTGEYDIVFAFNGAEVASSNPVQDGTLSQAFIGYNTSVNLPMAYINHAFGWKPYGDSTPCGVAGDARVVWIDTRNNLPATPGASKINLTINLAAGVDPTDTPTFHAALYRHLDETRKELVTTSTAVAFGPAQLISLSVTSSGYHSVWLSINDRVNGIAYSNDGFPYSITGVLTIDCATAFQHVWPKALEGKEDILGLMRVNGSSLLLQNTSAEQARGGTVYAAQLTGDKQWYETLEDVRDISNSNVVSRYVGDWSKGFYGYVKPQGQSPMDLQDVWEKLDDPTSHVHLPMFRPFARIGTVIALIQPPTPLGGTFSPTQYTMHVIRAIEFTTNDQFFDVETPIATPEEFDSYIKELAGMPQFFENPLHLAAIAALLSRAAMLAIRYGPAVYQGIRQLMIAKGAFEKGFRNRKRGSERR